MTESFEILESAEGDARLLRVRGELDISTAPQLDNRLRALLEQHRRVTLDLADLSFLDSTGIAVLVTAAQTAQDDGSGLLVRGIRPSVLRVLELSGVLSRLNLVPGQD